MLLLGGFKYRLHQFMITLRSSMNSALCMWRRRRCRVLCSSSAFQWQSRPTILTQSMRFMPSSEKNGCRFRFDVETHISKRAFPRGPRLRSNSLQRARQSSLERTATCSERKMRVLRWLTSDGTPKRKKTPRRVFRGFQRFCKPSLEPCMVRHQESNRLLSYCF